MNSVIGSPIPVRVGRRILFVSYVSMSEWQSFGELLKLDDTKAVLELLYYSLHRAEPTITRKRIVRLARWHAKHLLPLVDTICDMSLPKLKAKVGVSDKPGADSERDIKTVYRLLSRIHGWTPRQIDTMSPAQVHIYLTGGEDGTGIVKMSNSEYKSFLANRMN